MHVVPRLPRLPRKSGGDQMAQEGRQRDTGAYIRRLPRKRGGDQGTPKGHRGVHPTPWQRTLFHAHQAKATSNAHCPMPATQKRRRPRYARGTLGRASDPLAVHIVPRLPCKRGGDQGAPEGHRGVHPTPWQCTLSHACHTKEAETKGRQRDTGAYIRPLGSAHCPTPATQKKRRPRDARGTPGRTSDPLAVRVVLRLPRKSGGDQMAPEGRQRDATETPGRTSDPLAMHVVPRLPRKSGGDWGTSGGDQMAPEGRQTLCHACHAKSVKTKWHQRNARGTPARAYIRPPWQCTLCHASHAKAAETKGHQRDARGTPGRTSDPFAMSE